MPCYRTHVKVNLLIGLPLALAALKYTANLTVEEVISFTGTFIYGTYFLSPDVDIAYKTKLFSLKGLLTLPFRPYSYIFRHRGISHIPVIGTLTRVAWILGFCYLFFGTIWFSPILWFAIGGLATADLFHILLDRIN